MAPSAAVPTCRIGHAIPAMQPVSSLTIWYSEYGEHKVALPAARPPGRPGRPGHPATLTPAAVAGSACVQGDLSFRNSGFAVDNPPELTCQQMLDQWDVRASSFVPGSHGPVTRWRAPTMAADREAPPAIHLPSSQPRGLPLTLLAACLAGRRASPPVTLAYPPQRPGRRVTGRGSWWCFRRPTRVLTRRRFNRP